LDPERIERIHRGRFGEKYPHIHIADRRLLLSDHSATTVIGDLYNTTPLNRTKVIGFESAPDNLLLGKQWLVV